VREAACAVLEELLTKVADETVIEPFRELIVAKLVTCCSDMSWPVRDSAVSSLCQMAILCKQSMAEQIPSLFELWKEGL